MTDETTAVPEKTMDNVDDEVQDLIADMIGLLCDRPSEEMKITQLRGQRTVKFILKLTDAHHPGMVIGREGRTINAIRRYLSAVGGTYGRRYEFDLADMPPRRS